MGQIKDSSSWMERCVGGVGHFVLQQEQCCLNKQVIAGRHKCSQNRILQLQQKMIIRNSIFFIAIVLLLIQHSKTSCLLPTQLDGLCTSCPSPNILSSGFCFTPIAGCISQLSPSLCGQCATGYTLTSFTCIPTGGTPSSTNTINLNIYTNSGYDYRYQLFNFNLKQKYSQHLSDKISDITQLITLPTTYGFIYTITYFNPYSNVGQYRGEGSVDYFYNITEYSFGPASTNTSNLLWFINRKVYAANLPALSASLLNKVQFTYPNDFRLFYLDFTGKIQVIDTQKTLNTSSTYRTFINLTQVYYQVNQNTVINYVFSIFPILQQRQTYVASYYTLLDANNNPIDYFKFIFDNQVIVIIQVNGLDFSLYSYQEPNNINTTTPSPSGGYLPLLILTDPIYLGVYNFLISKYPFLAYKYVQNVRYQLVAGTNFMITLKSQPFSNDQYVALAFQPLGALPPVINSLYKNGIDITNTVITAIPSAYNYEADMNFKSLYTYFSSSMSSQLGTLLPISQVLYTANPNITYTYQVLYNSQQAATLLYSPNTASTYSILSYSSMGVQIPITATTISAQSGVDVTRNAIMQFLKVQSPTIFNVFLMVSSVQSSPGVYNLDILTSYGTYFARVINKNLWYLSAISVTSTNLCSDLSTTEFTSNSVVASLNTFLTSSYPSINGYSLQLVQGFITSAGQINYRLLYSLGQNRYEFQMVYSVSVAKYLTNKVTLLNGGSCNPTSVLVGSSCVQNCQSFLF